eukprot:s3485_g9.t2
MALRLVMRGSEGSEPETWLAERLDERGLSQDEVALDLGALPETRAVEEIGFSTSKPGATKSAPSRCRLAPSMAQTLHRLLEPLPGPALCAAEPSGATEKFWRWVEFGLWVSPGVVMERLNQQYLAGRFVLTALHLAVTASVLHGRSDHVLFALSPLCLRQALQMPKACRQGNCAIRDELSESCRQSWQVNEAVFQGELTAALVFLSLELVSMLTAVHSFQAEDMNFVGAVLHGGGGDVSCCTLCTEQLQSKASKRDNSVVLQRQDFLCLLPRGVCAEQCAAFPQRSQHLALSAERCAAGAVAVDRLQGTTQLRLAAKYPKWAFHATALARPLRTLETPLLQALLAPKSSKSLGCGYLTLDERRCVLCLMQNEALAQEVPLVGVWVDLRDQEVSNLPTLAAHPAVWAAAAHFVHQRSAKEKVWVEASTFLIMAAVRQRAMPPDAGLLFAEFRFEEEPGEGLYLASMDYDQASVASMGEMKLETFTADYSDLVKIADQVPHEKVKAHSLGVAELAASPKQKRMEAGAGGFRPEEPRAEAPRPVEEECSQCGAGFCSCQT